MPRDQLADTNQSVPSPVILSTAFACCLAVTWLIFVWVSTETTMGVIQRTFYFHVPAAFAAFVAVFVGGVASVWFLVTRDQKADDLAAAAGEAVVIFSMINIVLGSIWGRRVWGIWWTWDARLTSSLMLVLIYCGYLMVRKAADGPQRAPLCAVFCLLGMADVPLIYMSNRLFRTQHPAPVLGGGENSGLASDMLVTFIAANVAMLLVLACVIRLRYTLSSLESRLETLTFQFHSYTDGGSSGGR